MHQLGQYCWTCCLVLILLSVAGCSLSKTAESPNGNQSNTVSEPKESSSPATQAGMEPKSDPGALQVGQASGSYTAKGETVELKYAYAARGERFGSDSVIILVTDKPIPSEAVAEEIKSQPMLYDEKVRGLEYVISADGYWVRFHPSQYQESKGGKPKEYSEEGDIVRGHDEDSGDLTSGKYSRSVRFVAKLAKD